MDIWALLLLAIGLSMDAFAVSICKALAMKKITWQKSCVVGLWFGGFQALMPTIGYFLGIQFEEYITAYDHWIAFGLLLLIGANMIKESFCKEEADESDSLRFQHMLLLAIATSIDALAVGVTFAFLQVNIWQAVSFIGVVTFAFSVVGMKLGNVFGMKHKSKAEFAGGLILILLGIKILLEHLGIL